MKYKIFRFLIIALLLCILLPLSISGSFAGSNNKMLRINALLNTEVTDDILIDLSTHGKVRHVIYEINAVMLMTKISKVSIIRALPYGVMIKSCV